MPPLSPDGSLLAAACEDGAIDALDMATGEHRQDLKGHAAGVNAVAFSADGKRLATASEDQKIKVWEVATGSLLLTLSGHATGVKDVAFAPDGRSLASVGGQYRGTPISEVFVWDLASGSLVTDLEGHTSLVTAVAFFPDGRRLATASDDRTIKLWDPDYGRRCFHAQGAYQRRRQPGGQPRRPPDRLRQHRLHGPDLECRAARDPGRSGSPPGRRRARPIALRTDLLKSKVLEAIRTDPSLNEPSRAAALEIARRQSEDAQSLYEAAWLTILRPTGQPELNQQALERIEAACKLVTADPDRLQEYQHALSLALYRAGRPEEAIQTLDRLQCEAVAPRPGRPRHGQPPARPLGRGPIRARPASLAGQRPGAPTTRKRRDSSRRPRAKFT